MDATLSYLNGEPTLRFERRLAHSPAKVWRAITEPAELAHWFPAAVETELRPGAPMRFTFPDEAVVDGVWDGEVLEVDEPKVFMFRWNDDVLRFELTPDGDGCHLVFTQTVGGGRIGLLGAGSTAAGWDTCLDALTTRLDGGTPAADDDWFTATTHYVAKFGIDTGTAEPIDDGWTVRFARNLVWRSPTKSWEVLTEDTEITEVPPVRATADVAPAGKIVEVEPPRVLAYEWLHEGAPAGVVRWEFHSDPRLGERVELSQTIPAHLAHLRATVLATWHHHMELFFAAVMGDDRCGWSDDRVAELTERYG